MSHLLAVRDLSCARLPILRAWTGSFSALQRHSLRCLGSGLAHCKEGRLTRKSEVFPRPGQAKMLCHFCACQSCHRGAPFGWQSLRPMGTGIDHMGKSMVQWFWCDDGSRWKHDFHNLDHIFLWEPKQFCPSFCTPPTPTELLASISPIRHLVEWLSSPNAHLDSFWIHLSSL